MLSSDPFNSEIPGGVHGDDGIGVDFLLDVWVLSSGPFNDEISGVVHGEDSIGVDFLLDQVVVDEHQREHEHDGHERYEEHGRCAASNKHTKKKSISSTHIFLSFSASFSNM